MTLVNAYRRWWLGLRLWHSELALCQIDKLNPDVNDLVLEIRSLSDQLDQLKGAA